MSSKYNATAVVDAATPRSGAARFRVARASVRAVIPLSLRSVSDAPDLKRTSSHLLLHSLCTKWLCTAWHASSRRAQGPRRGFGRRRFLARR